MSTLIVGLSLLGTLTAAVPSPAPASQSDALIGQAVALRRQGLHEQAFEMFRRAHEKAPSAKTRAQMGLALQSLKRWVESESDLVAALATTRDPWIRKNRVPLEQALASVSRRVGEIVVRGTSGAEIYGNGILLGTLPLEHSLRVGDGNLVVQATAPGHQPFVTTVTVVGGSKTQIDAELEKVTPAVAPPTGVAKTASVDLDRPAPWTLADDALLPVTSEERPGLNWRKTFGTGLAVAGAATIITGVAALAIDGNPTCGSPTAGQCPTLRDTAALGWTLLGISAASSIAAGVLLYQGTHSEFSVGLNPTGLRAFGRF